MLIYSKSQGRVIDTEKEGLGATPQAAMPDKSLTEKIGDAALSLVKPFTETAKNIGAAAILPGQVIASDLASRINPKLGEDIASADILGTQTRAKQFDTGETGVKALTSEKGRKEIEKQLRSDAEILSYAVPFGKGTGIVSRAVVPGLASGALQGLGKEDATLGSIVGSSILGGVSAGILDGIFTKVLGGGGANLENVASKARTGNVYTKSSLYGAEEEKLIEETMQKYGIKGTPQKKYEMVKPVFDDISKGIGTTLEKNPLSATPDMLKSAFDKKLATMVRTGDITKAEGELAFNEYFKNVAEVTPEIFDNTMNISTPDLFNLKQDLQSGMSSLYKKIDNSNSLTGVQKITKTLRDSLDTVLAELHPDLKMSTMEQSRLFDAAEYLGRVRKTVPTERFMGITIPKKAVSNVKDAFLSTAEKTGSVASTAEKIPASFIGSRIPSIVSVKNGDQITNSVDNQPSNLNSQPDLNKSNNNVDHGQIVPLSASGSQVMGLGKKPSLFGNASKEDVLSSAVAAGLKMSDIKQISDLYDMVSPVDSKKTEKQQLFANASLAGQQALDLLNTGKISTGLGQGILGGLGEKIGTNSASQQEYRSTVALARTAARSALLGANMSAGELESISSFIPEYNDAPEIARKKLETFVRLMDTFGNNLKGTSSGLGSTPQALGL